MLTPFKLKVWKCFSLGNVLGQIILKNEFSLFPQHGVGYFFKFALRQYRYQTSKKFKSIKNVWVQFGASENFPFTQLRNGNNILCLHKFSKSLNHHKKIYQSRQMIPCHKRAGQISYQYRPKPCLKILTLLGKIFYWP